MAVRRGGHPAGVRAQPGTGVPSVDRGDVVQRLRVGRSAVRGQRATGIPELREIGAALIRRVLVEEQLTAHFKAESEQIGLDEPLVGQHDRDGVRQDAARAGSIQSWPRSRSGSYIGVSNSGAAIIGIQRIGGVPGDPGREPQPAANAVHDGLRRIQRRGKSLPVGSDSPGARPARGSEGYRLSKSAGHRLTEKRGGMRDGGAVPWIGGDRHRGVGRLLLPRTPPATPGSQPAAGGGTG